MTDEEVLKVASDVGWNIEHRATNDYIIKLARTIAAHEREACARICDAWPTSTEYTHEIATAIRSRT